MTSAALGVSFFFENDVGAGFPDFLDEGGETVGLGGEYVLEADSGAVERYDLAVVVSLGTPENAPDDGAGDLDLLVSVVEPEGIPATDIEPAR